MGLFSGGGWRLLAVGAMTVAVVGSGATAAAAAGPARLVVDTAPLVLGHDGVRYTGDLRVTVRNVGGTAADHVSVRLGLPAGLKFETSNGAGVCLFGADDIGCTFFAPVEAGARVTYTLTFGAFAAPAVRARVTAEAAITVTPGDPGSPGAASDRYAGILRGTTGSIRNPRPYAPSTEARTRVTAGPAVVQQAADGYEVRIPVTVRAGADIPNDYAAVWTTTPPGGGFVHTEPSAVCAGSCMVPGQPTWFAAGETRTFTLIFSYTPPALPVAETVTVRVEMRWGANGQPEAAPAQNTATVPLVIAA
ncbi:hypothetical protein [Virgisporangium ochraceum]|uniref:DUF11 domain-containing protein n=1 Tax=Virgisporangium ochraceum TaxID=65505 RepID=A0A8J4A0H5_9ACTN|nr:hypothetical protein [Virgisporangium ochraceum]GIJ73544.1 hypothetical protein Voc01_084610 [Virgisporangium ochraceum]